MTDTSDELDEIKRWRWLASTRLLQEEAYGDDVWPKEGDELADYVTWNYAAAVAELSEALNEVGWKNWAKPRGWVNREAFIGELIDASHFIANLAVAVGCTDEEWEECYRAKQELNHKRQRKNYDGRNKCPECKRALDDSLVQCTKIVCTYGT